MLALFAEKLIEGTGAAEPGEIRRAGTDERVVHGPRGSEGPGADPVKRLIESKSTTCWVYWRNGIARSWTIQIPAGRFWANEDPGVHERLHGRSTVARTAKRRMRRAHTATNDPQSDAADVARAECRSEGVVPAGTLADCDRSGGCDAARAGDSPTDASAVVARELARTTRMADAPVIPRRWAKKYGMQTPTGLRPRAREGGYAADGVISLEPYGGRQAPRGGGSAAPVMNHRGSFGDDPQRLDRRQGTIRHRCASGGDTFVGPSGARVGRQCRQSSRPRAINGT